MPSTEARCACCDLPWYSCGTTLERRQGEDAAAVRDRAMHLPGVIASRHPGTCASCGERFPERTPIRKAPDGWESVLCCGKDDL